MTTRPMVTVITPCFNHGRFLGQALDSALALNYSPIEIIVVDDGSTDETPEVAGSYLSRIRFFRTPHRGLSHARNFALRRMRGDFVVFLDADNELLPNFLDETLPLLQAADDPRVAYVYTQRFLFGPGVREGAVSRFPPFDLSMLLRKNYLDTCSLIRADVARRFGFDPAFFGAEDHDFFLTASEHGFVGRLLDLPLYRYRVHEQSNTAVVVRNYMQKEIALRMIRKHAALYGEGDARDALRVASEKIVCAVVRNRSHGRPFLSRLRDLGTIVREMGPLDECLRQVHFIVHPAGFLRKSKAPGEGG